MSDDGSDHGDDPGGVMSDFETNVGQNIPVTKTGWLVKEGGNFQSWKKRLFVLKNQCMAYYAKQGERKPKGYIILDGCQIRDADPNKCKKPHTFEIYHPQRRTYRCQCASDDEKNEWIAVIRHAIEDPLARERRLAIKEKTLKKKLAELNSIVESLQEEQNYQRAQLDKKELDMSDQDTRIQDLQGEIRILRGENEQQKAEISALNERLSEKGMVDTQVQAQARMIADLQSQLQEQKTQLLHSQDELIATKDKCKALRAYLRTLQKEQEDSKQTIMDLETKLAEVTHQTPPQRSETPSPPPQDNQHPLLVSPRQHHPDPPAQQDGLTRTVSSTSSTRRGPLPPSGPPPPKEDQIAMMRRK